MKKITGISLVCIVIVAVLLFYFPIKVMKIKNEDEKIMTTIRLHGKQRYENEGLYCIRLYIDGEPFSCILDTGSNLNEIYKPNTIPIYAVTTFPSTYTLYGKIFNVAQRVCYIYEIKADSDILRLMPFYDSSSYVDKLFPGTWKPEVLLGAPFFNNYIVCFDFKHKQVGVKEIKLEKK